MLYDFNVADHRQIAVLVRKYLYDHIVKQIFNLQKLETSFLLAMTLAQRISFDKRRSGQKQRMNIQM